MQFHFSPVNLEQRTRTADPGWRVVRAECIRQSRACVGTEIVDVRYCGLVQ